MLSIRSHAAGSAFYLFVDHLNHLTNPVQIFLLFNRVRVLTLILRHAFEPIIRILQAHCDKGLDHTLAENGALRLPICYLLGNYTIPKLSERLWCTLQ